MRKLLTMSLTVLIVFICGCTGGGNPLNPDETTAVGFKQTSASPSSHKLMGLWQGIINPDKQTLEFVRLRNGDFHLNALHFLEPPPLLNLTLESLKFIGNTIEADIGLRHPFLGLTEFTGFDVCGIFISNGSVTGFDDPSLRMAGAGDTRLLNPDAYSRWWNPAEFPHGGNIFSYKEGLLGTPDSAADYNSTLNPYKYFCDDLGPNDALNKVTLTKRGMFSAGQKNIRHYTIDMGAGLIFNYAVDACWVFPTGTPPWLAPYDFPPAANRPEAWNAIVSELSNTLWNDGSEKGGGLKLQVDVYDWFNASLNEVKVESPGNFPLVTSTTPIAGGECFSTYEIEVLDATPAEGSIDLLISVVSENIGYGDLLPGKPVTAYFLRNVKVSPDKPQEVEFPVMIDGTKNYWAARFVEDSNGVFHVVASWADVHPNWEIRWFVSTDKGAAWKLKGNLANPPSVDGGYAPSLCFHLAADKSGGVYLLYGENKNYPGGPILAGFLKYLDTSIAAPSDWVPTHWLSKRVFTLDYACGAQNCAITISPSNQILMTIFDWRYCEGDRGLKFNYAPNGWASVVDGSPGAGVDPSLIATGTGDLYYMYPSGCNNLVYHQGTGHFFYSIGGSFTFKGSGEYTGVCVLEFDPGAAANKWTMASAFQNPGMGNSNSIMQNYHGDLAVDSSGNVHWVHVSTYPTSPIYYDYNYVQFRFVHGVRDNSTGTWSLSDTPINGTWDFPTPPPGGAPNNRADNEPVYVNLVNTTNGILLSWLQSCTYPNYKSSLLTPGGSFSEPAKIQLSASEYPLVLSSGLALPNTFWAGAQGEAVGDKLALPFTCKKDSPTDIGGELWFTMFTGL